MMSRTFERGRALAATAMLVASAACTEAAVTPMEPLARPRAAAAAADQVWVIAFSQQNALPPGAVDLVTRAGGKVLYSLGEIGGMAVTSSNPNFATQVASDPSVKSAALATATSLIDPPRALDQGDNGGNVTTPGPDPQPGSDPLFNQQWDKMRMNVSATGSYAIQQGRKDVRVAILDTGTDPNHPDIAANFDAADSRSFVPSEPTIQDFNGHGTWCMSAVGAPINGIGISGVAPNVSLVSLKVLDGTGSGYFFYTDLALIYAGVKHFDVASMSLGGYIPKNGNVNGDHPDYILLQRAVQFARSNGVLPVAAMGNNNFDVSDGNFFRSYVEAPGEIAGVVGVSATGYYNQKAFYSNYGMGKTDVSAPGGSTRNYTGVPGSGAPPPPYNGIGRVIGAWSTTGESIDFSNPNLGVEQCTGPSNTPPCFPYAWVQGTSMATPNAAGVAALIVSQYGDFSGGGNPNKPHMSPTTVEQYLQISANNQPCPEPRTVLAGPGFNPPTATCQGDGGYNSFFGKGIVDAVKAVTLH